jgi:L-lactate dehydrogenase complex protein LldE
MKVSLFIPCLNDQLFPQVGVATVKLLRKVGVEVDYPAEQTCCGQPAFNTGYRDNGRFLAERFIKVFSKSDYVVAPSGSCVSMVKVFYDELALPENLKSELQGLKKRIFELSEFLVDVMHVTDVGANFNGKVTYHESCHLLRELHVSEQPRRLIGNVKGLEFIEMNESKRCCGFGGTFSVKFPELSCVLTEDKVNNIESCGADFVVGCDSSCLMNIDGVLKKKSSNIRTMHLSELLISGWGKAD